MNTSQNHHHHNNAVQHEETKVSTPRKRRGLRVASEIVAKPGSVPDQATVQKSVASVKAVVTELGVEPAANIVLRKTLTGESAIPAGFLDVSLDVAEQCKALVADHFDAAAVADAQSYLKAMQPFRSLVRVLYRQVEDEVLRKRAVLGTECRRLYRYMQWLQNTTHAAETAEPLDRLTQAMKKGKVQKTSAPSQASTAPAAEPKT